MYKSFYGEKKKRPDAQFPVSSNLISVASYLYKTSNILSPATSYIVQGVLHFLLAQFTLLISNIVLNQLIFSYYSLLNFPPPWTLYKCKESYQSFLSSSSFLLVMGPWIKVDSFFVWLSYSKFCCMFCGNIYSCSLWALVFSSTYLLFVTALLYSCPIFRVYRRVQLRLNLFLIFILLLSPLFYYFSPLHVTFFAELVFGT